MAHIDGTSGNDSLIGTSDADTIDGGGGNDTLEGGANNDLIYGDSNNLSPHAADTTNTTVANNFQVISLGNAGFDIDPTETGGSSGISENGSWLNGATYGSTGDPLSDNVVQLVAGGGNGDGQYDGDQTVSSDTFWINGTQYTFDGSAVYNNTIVTFEDGSTATVSAVVFQDTSGNLYLAPESSNNADTSVYTSQPITSIELGTQDTSGAIGNGLVAARVVDSWVENSEVVIGPDGDDVIDGGDGSDTIYGEGGNDSISGGIGDDTIHGDYTETAVIGDDFTSGGWTGSATLDSDRATFDADNQWTNAVTTTPTGMSSGDGAGGGAQITLDFVWSDGITSGSSGSADFYIDYDGVNYVQITTPNDGSTATITYNNGASGPPGPIAEGDALAGTGFTTLTFYLPIGIADSGELEFWADTTGGEDNFSVDNVIVSRNAHITSPGNDTINGGDGNDVIDGGEGDDSLDGGTGNDTVIGGTGSDTILLHDGYGGDSITGGEDAGDGDVDVIDASGITADGVAVFLSGNEDGSITSTEGTANFVEIERFVLTDQADVVDATNDTAGTNIDAGAGDDAIEYGQGSSTVLGGDGNDDIDDGAGVAYFGTDSLDGGAGQDTIYAGWGDDTIIGGADADLLYGEGDNDSITGDGGSDTIYGGDGADTIDAGSEDDSIDGGTGNDLLTGGGGDDTFSYSVGDGNDTITDFNAGSSGTLSDGDNTNNDFINLSGFYDNLQELYADQADDGILNQSNTADSKGRSVDYSDNSQFGAGDGLTFQGAAANNSSFTEENTGVVCFAAGTLILTDKGEVPLEKLRPEDKIVTYDNGLQPLAMLAARRLGPEQLSLNPELKPIEIKPGALGGKQRLLVSPQHMMLVLHEGEERFVRARQLSRLKGGAARVMEGCRRVTYFHLIFDAHQIVFANKRPAESFFPGPRALAALDIHARREFDVLFPGINDEHIGPTPPKGWKPARTGLRTHLLPKTVVGLRGTLGHGG